MAGEFNFDLVVTMAYLRRDFDIEANSGNEYYQYMIETLRSNFASDLGNTYFITAAP